MDDQASLPRSRAWALALVATFTMTISYLDRQVLAVLAPTVTAALQIDETQYGVLVAAFSLAYLIGSPLAGRLLDKVGARKGLLIAVLLWSVVAATHSLATGFVSLFILRILLGLAEAPSFPGAAQTVQRALPLSDRPRGLGILFTGSSLGAMIAPPLANKIEHTHGWAAAFIGTASVGLVWVPIWLLLTSKSDAKQLLDHAPAAAEQPSTFELLKHRSVIRAIAAVLALAPAVAFGLLWGAKYLVFQFNLKQNETTPYLLVPLFLFDIGAVLFGDLAARRQKQHGGPSAEGPKGLFLVASVFALAIAAVPFAQSPIVCALTIGVSVFGAGAMMALLTGQLLSRVPARAVSMAGGISAAAQSLAYVVANPLIGMSVDKFQSYTIATTALAVWILPGTIFWLMYDESPNV